MGGTVELVERLLDVTGSVQEIDSPVFAPMLTVGPLGVG